MLLKKCLNCLSFSGLFTLHPNFWGFPNGRIIMKCKKKMCGFQMINLYKRKFTATLLDKMSVGLKGRENMSHLTYFYC